MLISQILVESQLISGFTKVGIPVGFAQYLHKQAQADYKLVNSQPMNKAISPIILEKRDDMLVFRGEKGWAAMYKNKNKDHLIHLICWAGNRVIDEQHGVMHSQHIINNINGFLEPKIGPVNQGNLFKQLPPKKQHFAEPVDWRAIDGRNDEIFDRLEEYRSSIVNQCRRLVRLIARSSKWSKNDLYCVLQLLDEFENFESSEGLETIGEAYVDVVNDLIEKQFGTNTGPVSQYQIKKFSDKIAEPLANVIAKLVSYGELIDQC